MTPIHLSPTALATTPPTTAGQLLAVVRRVYEHGLAELATVPDLQTTLADHRRVTAFQALLGRMLTGRVERLRAQNLLSELRLRQERAIGHWLAAHVRHGGGGDRRSQSRTGTVVGDLPDGVSKKESSRFQKLAAIPEARFDHHLTTTRDAGREITTSGVLKLFVTPVQPVPTPTAPTTDRVADLEELVRCGRTFGTIYADPPWEYGNRATRGAAARHYRTLTVEQIARLPVANLAAEAAHLHLWTTNAFLFAAEQVIRAWGFEYKSCFVWTKPTVGLGNYWRVAHEFLLLGVRGKCPFRNRGQRSWQCIPGGEHSAKPERVRQLIELVSPGPYLELFARRRFPGWLVWGDQVEVET
jgi:N6-adenosine-specific RNA methylase IME4